MSIKLELVAGNSLLYNGTEDDFYKSYSLILDNGDKLIVPALLKHRLKDLENEGGINIANSILSSLQNLKKVDYGNDLWGYVNEEGLTVYVFETEKYLVIVSKGEINRGIYKIIVEGVFQSPSTYNPLN